MNIIVTGAGGRMGKKVCALDGVNVVCAVDPNLDIKSISECTAPADGIIDFSYHGAAPEICGYAVSHGLPVVFATTGHTPDELEAIKSAARSVPVFMSANMSLGIAVLCDFAKKAAAVFPDADIEIVETHHNRKLDAPSGTALMLAEAVSEVREDAELVSGRVGQRPRKKGEIGIHALRMGNIVGEHAVMICTDTQRLTLKHEAMDRALFAEGALRALEFISGKAPRMYTMKDMVSA